MIPIIKNIKKAILQAENPIGHIRFETTNINPSTYLGFGTWKLWGAGRVPVGVDTTDDDFAEVEKTGGEKTHTLTINEIPSHNHVEVFGNHDWVDDGGSGASVSGNRVSYRDTLVTKQNITSSVGGDQSHNNVQPYVTCYMWKRTA